MRQWIDLLSESALPRATPEQQEKILSDWRVKRGPKVGVNTKLWRGESEDSGNGMATYGQGYYFTTNRSYAKQYGDVVEVSRDSLPWGCLRFETINDQQIWTQQAEQTLGLKGRWHQYFHDYSDFLRAIDPEIDGLQIGKGKDAIFVKFSGFTPLY